MNDRASEKISQNGMTLVELLVVLAIIAALAGLIYPAVMDSIKKSAVSMAAQRIDAVEKAKVQYRLDYQGAAPLDETQELTARQLSQYLVRLGQPIGMDDRTDMLSQGTGGTVHIGSLSTGAWFEAKNKDARTLQLLTQNGIPTSQPTPMTVTASP